ncbi:MAG: nucleotidyltransferase family protein [Burkholderiaceae bacterium]|jgi:MurNAc alpha-1-phosphate uridylyltransferase|nr:nucleotidyltransferase family protein [Burkholderiaceae bacterium]
MKAMIFAAGRGERLRPLTDNVPKPLLEVRGRPLIVWHILNLVRAGITDMVINHAWLGHKIEEALGDGSRFGARIVYSPEGDEALETAGGVARARHLLGEDRFVGIAADAYCPHFDYSQVSAALQDNDVWGNPHGDNKKDMAWLYLVKKPPYYEQGDFSLNLFSVSNAGERRFTFSGIGVYRMAMFDAIVPGEKVPLGNLLRAYADRGLVGGEVYRGDWTDVGTVERFEKLNAPLSFDRKKPGLPS